MRLAAFVLALAASLPVLADQPYPTKPVKLVVPFPAGGPVDLIARVVGDKLGSELGQPVVIENRNGAGGVTGTAMVARAEPDGYTIALTSAGALAINTGLQERLPYDALKDLALVTLVAVTPEVLVIGRGVPARTAADLVALAKANPGTLNFASTGKGSMSHLSSEQFRLAAGIDIVHVPYSGAAPAINDLVGGHVQMMFADITVLVGSIQSGQLRALAVGGKSRAVPLPDVPTVAEAGLPQVLASNWYGVVAPQATPAEIVARLHDGIVQALKADEVKAKLVPQGAELVGDTQQEFREFVAAEIDKWSRVVRDAKIKDH